MQTSEPPSSFNKSDLPSSLSRTASHDIDIAIIAGERVHSVSEMEKMVLPEGFRNQHIRLMNRLSSGRGLSQRDVWNESSPGGRTKKKC